MTTPTWPPEVVERVAEWLWVRSEESSSRPWYEHWEEAANSDREDFRNEARKLLNAIAEAGEGNVFLLSAVDFPEYAYVTPAPLEEK